ncbi:MAG: hypothetical protein B6D37_09285 [Sphingobacteriales bacterium UTBCD1]|jgi:hypothetical protein|nr:MAG: hypothetical protein B6D37_09285 [Sphingobacteriales bacterium UTBCD1]
MRVLFFKSSIFLFFLFLTFVKGLTQSIPLIRIDPTNAYGGTMSDFFDEIEYIPLETTTESLLGSASKLVITDSSFVIGDYDTKSIFFFTPSGKFITRARLPYENSISMNISYETDRKMISVISFNWDTEKGICKYYTLTGKLIDTPKENITKETSAVVYLGSGFNLGINWNYLYKGESPKNSTFFIFSTYKKGIRYKSFLPFNQANSLAFSRLMGSYITAFGNPLKAQNGYLYAAEPLTFKTFKINKDTAIASFQFVLPYERVIPKTLIEGNNLKSIDSLKETLSFDNKTILQISNIFYYRNYLFFKLIPRMYLFKPNSDPEFQYNFMYDTLTKKLISIEKISPDASSYFLSALGHIAQRDGIEYFNGNLYTSLSALEMFNQMEKTKEKAKRYPPALDKYFSTETRKSNPVIVKLKLRKEL